VTGSRRRKRKQLLDEFEGKWGLLKIERRSTISHSVNKWLWKKLRTCLKTDCRM